MNNLKETPRRRRLLASTQPQPLPEFSPLEKAEAWLSLGIGDLYYRPRGRRSGGIHKLDTEWEDLTDLDDMDISPEMREIIPDEQEPELSYPEEPPEVTEIRVVKSQHSTTSLRCFT